MRSGTAPVGPPRAVVALLLSVFCSSSAALLGVTVLGKQVYDLTGRELDLGLLGLAEFAPAALLVLVTGSVADRLDRRRVAATALLGEAMAGLGLAWYASTRPTSAGPIFVLVLVFGVARAFAAPATRALPGDVVVAERLPKLVARSSVAWQSAIVVGPVLGGFLYAVDVVLPYLAMAVLLSVAATAVLVVQVLPSGRRAAGPAGAAVPTVALEPATQATAVEPDGRAGGEPSLAPPAHAPSPGGASPPRPGWDDAMQGLRFIRRNPVLFGAISLDLFAVLFGGAVALLPAIAEDRLGVGAVGLGWLRAAGGIGAAVVTLGLVVRPVTRTVGRTLLGVVAVFGLFTIVLGATRNFVVAFLALAALSGADAVSVYIRSTLVPLVTPEGMRGRVLAVENVFIGGSNELGAFESGVAGQLLGAAPAVMLGGLATVVIAVLWWVRFPALRDVDRFPGQVARSGP